MWWWLRSRRAPGEALIKTSSPRARRVPVGGPVAAPSALDSLANPDYADCFAITPAPETGRSAKAWMREVLEGAPRPVRWFVRFGWRVGLGLRPGPRDSPTHVLGWRIESCTPVAIVLTEQSALVTAHLVLRADTSELRLATFVRYEHRAARAVWTIGSIVHRRIAPYLLTRAASAPAPHTPES